MNRLFLLCAAAALPAGEAPPKVEAKPGAPELRAPYALDDYVRWNFEPPVNRPDAFYDQVAVLEAEAKEQQELNTTRGAVRPNNVTAVKGEDIQQLLAWAREQRQMVETQQNARRWADARAAAESGVTTLDRYKDDPAQPALGDYHRFFVAARLQAEDALNLEEARAAFDALNIRVTGIFWAEAGTRMAIIADLPRAVKVRERVRDQCFVSAIDTDRVDFRFLFAKNGKSYEFARYVNDELRKALAIPRR
jgi:hypothetical protein